jgi:hypothetical protein
MVQMELQLLPATPQAFSLVAIVREVLLAHDWLTPYQLQAQVEARTGTWHSDASISARLRELRREEYGHHVIIKRKRAGSRSYEYRLEA